MKGGVALALVGLLAVIMGVRGTYKEVWAALSGQKPGAPSSGSSTPAPEPSGPTKGPGALAPFQPLTPAPATGVGGPGPLPGQPGNPQYQI